MKVFAIALLKPVAGLPEPVFLSRELELSSFGFFERSGAQQVLTFACRTVCGRTPPGTRQSVQHDKYVVHCFVRSDGLGATFVTDEDYEKRVAFTYLTKLITEYDAEMREHWMPVEADAMIPYPPLKQHVIEYQDPAKVDKIVKIQKDLDETMDVMHKSIESILERGQNLDEMVDRSKDLSDMSKAFYKQAKAHNSCCVIS